MNGRIDEAVAARAYELWEKAGKPEGRDAEFWHLAEQELINEDKSSPLRTPDTLCSTQIARSATAWLGGRSDRHLTRMSVFGCASGLKLIGWHPDGGANDHHQ
ncbi:DUF2934 domain-containing protein [Bradyrhizobium embrapense]